MAKPDDVASVYGNVIRKDNPLIAGCYDDDYKSVRDLATSLTAPKIDKKKTSIVELFMSIIHRLLMLEPVVSEEDSDASE